jgi:hypothetical protein
MTAADYAKNTFMDALADMARGLYTDEEWKLYRDLSAFLKRYRADCSGYIPGEYKADAEKAKTGRPHMETAPHQCPL